MLLEDQDRRCGTGRRSRPGAALLDRAIALRGRGPYVSRRRSPRCRPSDQSTGREVAALYGRLAELTGSPVVELNRAAAVAQTGRPRTRSQIVDRLELDDYRYLHSTRAELLRRLGRAEEARAAFERALELAGTEPERRFLRRRIAEL